MRCIRKTGIAGVMLLLSVICNPLIFSKEPETSDKSILNTQSQWRYYIVRGAEQVISDSGELNILHKFDPTSEFMEKTGKGNSSVCTTALPAETWRQPDFDDKEWPCGTALLRYAYKANRRGDYRANYFSVPLVCLRGRFQVSDPTKTKDLSVSLSFNGGVIIYVNGKELIRSHMPEGEITYDTPALPYSKEAWYSPDGKPLNNRNLRKHPDWFKARTRHIKNHRIPGSMLQKGINVIAIENHRAPMPESFVKGKKVDYRFEKRHMWNRIGIISAALVSASGKGVNTGFKAEKKPRVRSHPIWSRLYVDDRIRELESPYSIKICGVRNGRFSGQVAINSQTDITGLKAEVSDLQGPGVIPAELIEIRYARPDATRFSGGRQGFDSLETIPPEKVPVNKKTGTAIQPVWITVAVPADAKAGIYQGELALNAQGMTPFRIPVKIDVYDWILPDSKEYRSYFGFMQSPQSVAIQYNVDIWSEKHWKLIERSFELLGQLGSDAVYIPMLRRTEMGNEHGMVRWIEQPGGMWKVDLSIVKRYIDTAVRHMGKPRVVCLRCWEPVPCPAWGGQGRWSSHTSKGKVKFNDREILYTVIDPKTGKLQARGTRAEGTAFIRVNKKGEVLKVGQANEQDKKTETGQIRWGTPECRAFWKPALDGIREILKQHDIEKSMMLGISCDYQPSKACVDDLAAVAPGARWVVHSHGFWQSIHGKPVGCLGMAWGAGRLFNPGIPNPYGKKSRFYGWKDSPFVVGNFMREGASIMIYPLLRYRFTPEWWMVASGRSLKYKTDSGEVIKGYMGTSGLEKMGADFWPVIKDKRGRSRPLCKRFLTDSYWGQLGLDYTITHILGPGKNGPVATARFEMYRENAQEIEARIFLENILTDPAKRSKIGKELADHCQTVLDERVRDIIRVRGERGFDLDWYACVASQRSRGLYKAAAQAGKALGLTD